MFIIQLPAATKTGWRKLRNAGPWLTYDAAEAYGRKYWGNRFRVVEVK